MPQSPGLMQHFDHVLLDRDEVWPAVRPDVVLQLGSRITSKRMSEFMSWAAQPSASRYVLLSSQDVIHDVCCMRENLTCIRAALLGCSWDSFAKSG